MTDVKKHTRKGKNKVSVVRKHTRKGGRTTKKGAGCEYSKKKKGDCADCK